MAGFLGTTFAALKHRNYRLYWTGQAVSLMGTTMQSAALSWLIYNSTGSPMLLALLGVFQFGPLLALALPAGVYVDRLPKRRLLLVTQSTFMLQALALSFLAFSGRADYRLILPLASVYGVAQAFDYPARRALLIDLVGRADLMNASSLNSAMASLARIVGPVLAGVAMTKLGAGWCFLLNGLSYVAVLVALTRINVDGGPADKPKDSHVGREALAGLSHIWHHESLRVVMLLALTVMIFGLNENVLIPVFTDRVLGMGVQAYGNLLSALGVGALAGALLGAAISHRVASGRLIIITGVAIGAIQMLQAVTHVFWLSAIIMVAFGAVSIVFATASASTVQLAAAAAMRGRVMSVYALVEQGTLPLGNAFAGAVTGLWGSQAGFLVCGAVTAALLLGIAAVERSRAGGRLLADQ